MKKALYIALAVQSLVLLGVVVALIYTAVSPPRSSVEPGSTEEVDGGAGELAPLEGPPLARSDGGEPSGDPPPHAAASEPEQEPGAVVSELVAGNERFARGEMRLRDALAIRKAPGRPRVVVLGCSDAVVPPEQVFDQPLGSLVVVRTAAHLVDDGATAAVDDALSRQHVRVVVVLGHLGCPTVAAALREPSRGEPELSGKLRPVLAPLKHLKGEALEVKAVEANVSWAVAELARRSKVLRAIRPTVLRAVYDEGTGEVRWLDAEANPGKNEDRRSPDTPR